MYASDAQNIEYIFSAGIYSWIPNSEVRVCASGSEIQMVSPPYVVCLQDKLTHSNRLAIVLA